MQHRIEENKALLNRDGHLTETGYATSLLLSYDRDAVRAGRWRIKEWDYYLVYNQQHAVAFTMADLGYMGLLGCTLIDFNERRIKTGQAITLLPLGGLGLPTSSQRGDVDFANRRLEMSFHNDGQRRTIHLAMDRFDKGTPIAMDFSLWDEPADSMVIATPFPHRPTAFYYNQKVIGMKARGAVRYRDQLIEFDSADTLALLDWGRGVWTYDNTWYWGAAHGYLDERIFGFNIGCGFGDTTAATENMLFYDGKAHKLADVFFHIPCDEAGRDNYLQPWTFSSSDGRFEMEFRPLLDRAARTSLGFLVSDQHQVFGRFTGEAKLADGRVVHLRDFLGFAEKVRNKW